MEFLRNLLLALTVVVFFYYVALYTYYVFLLLISMRGIWWQTHWANLMVEEQLERSPKTPPATLLVPAHNEAAGIVESVRALLGLRYPHLRVIVINDGSTDDTLMTLIRSFSMRRADLVYHPQLRTRTVRGLYLSNVEPRLLVVDKVGGGKSDALNAGINLTSSPWVCTVDADSILEEDALLRVMRLAIEDGTVEACSGIIRLVNGCRVAGGRVLKVELPQEKVVILQVVEYLQAFLLGRFGWDRLNALLIISGAFGVFRTETLRAVGGYNTETVGEDMEIVVRIHKHFRKQRKPYRILFVPDPVCWTEAPATVGMLRRQRRRWQRGLAEVLFMHRDLLLNPRMGTLGLLAMPYFYLEFFTPALELLGIIVVPIAWMLGWVSLEIFLLYLFFALLMGIVFAVAGVLFEEFSYRRYNSWRDLFSLLLFAVVEHLGYHQLVVWFRLEGTLDFLYGRGGWGTQARGGFRRSTQDD